jgi:hypothetical protein
MEPEFAARMTIERAERGMQPVAANKRAAWPWIALAVAAAAAVLWAT